jgi:aminodeoxyfutalosine synthase
VTFPATFDLLMERLTAGERLSPADIGDLARVPDILPLGMLADTVRRRVHGTRVTYLRVAFCGFDHSFTDAVPPAAREIRLTGAPPTLEVAIAAVRSAKAVAGVRAVAGFTWPDIDRLASTSGLQVPQVLQDLRAAGLEALASIPLDAAADAEAIVERMKDAGFHDLRLTIHEASAAERPALLFAAAALQERFACIRAINPLPDVLQPERPTTGYEDVKAVAIARLAAPNIPIIQVDWRLYGPKLAQVALTFGADDVDGVAASDEAPEGRRRAPLEEVRRNIVAAGFDPAERDGRFNIVTT